MFSLMGNCFSCIRRKRQQERPVTLAILGLDSAGKTTTTKAFLGENLDTAPTVGFNKEEFAFANYAITLYDLGGGQKIRDIWKDYLNEIYGVIYVVDSSARDRIQEVKDNLWNLVGHEMVKEKPILVLANKEDIKGHMDEVDIMEKLQLEEVVNINKSPSKMVMCSAIKGTGKKMDPNLRVGMNWLCEMLDQMYDKIKVRVDHDMEIAEQKRQKEKAERRERVRKQREERERLEEEENKRLGIKKEEEEEDDDDIVEGENPFRRLDSSEMQRKEERYRLAKEKEKERKKRIKELEDNDTVSPAFISENTVTSNLKNNEDEDGLHVPRSSRSLGSFGLFNGGLSRRKGSDEDADSDATAPRSGRQLLPPLQSPLGTKFIEGNSISNKDTKKKKKKQKQKGSKVDENEEIQTDNHVYGFDNYGQSTMSVSKIDVISKNEDSENSDKNLDGKDKYFQGSSPLPPDNDKKKKGKSRSQTQDDEDGFDTLRLSQHLDEEDSRSGRSITPIQKNSKLTNNDYSTGRAQTPTKKIKKKNRHLRKNKLAPSDDEFELSDVGQSPKREALPWARSASPKGLDTIEDRQDIGGRWGFADELTTMDEVKPMRRSQPNFDSDDPML